MGVATWELFCNSRPQYEADRGSLAWSWGTGSIVGAFIGGRLLGIFPCRFLLSGLARIIIASSVKVRRGTTDADQGTSMLVMASSPVATDRDLRPPGHDLFEALAQNGVVFDDEHTAATVGRRRG